MLFPSSAKVENTGKLKAIRDAKKNSQEMQSSSKPVNSNNDKKIKASQLCHMPDFVHTERCLSHVSKAVCKFLLLEKFRATKAQVLLQGNSVDDLS